MDLVDKGLIRALDLLIITKTDEGEFEAFEAGDLTKANWESCDTTRLNW